MSENNQTNQKSQSALREEAVLAFWKENNIFQKTLEKPSTKGEFIFYDGPPTANGMPGLHHVEPQSFKDAIPRYKTMQGFSVPRKAGWDTHGLPVELQVEKELGLKSKKEIESFGVAEFNQKCKESVWKYKGEWMKMRKRMGYWTDMDNAYITYENKYIEALWGVVAKANEREFLYKDFKVVPWCTRCGTGLSSHELSQPGAYKDVKDLSVYVKFKVIGEENTYILAWTTTPWTLPGNVGLAVGEDIDYVKVKISNSKITEHYIVAWDLVNKVFDKELINENGFGVTLSGPLGEEHTLYDVSGRYHGKDLIGMEYESLYPYLSNLVSDDQKNKIQNAFKVYPADFVTTTDGTGIVHTAVMYGADDFDLGTKYDLPKFHLVNEEGKFIEGTDFLEGRYVKEKDGGISDGPGKPTLAVDIIDELTSRGLLFKKENHMHSYPHCWRCDTPLVYYARTSWYFRMSALREQLLAANENINWEPVHIKEGRFGEWLDGIKDWAISRDRYWGTPLPIWQKADGSYKVMSSLDDLKTHAKKSGNKYFVMRHGETENNLKSIWSINKNNVDVLTENGIIKIKDSATSLVDKKIDLIITSPFSRTKQTAKIVADTIGLAESNILIEDRLSEWNVGSEFEGKSIDSYFQVRNEGDDRYGFKTVDGESYAEVLKRIGDCMYDIEQKYQGKNILIVSHGAPVRAIELVSDGFSLHTLFEQTRSYVNFGNAEIRNINFVPLPHNANYELDFHKPFIDEVTLVDEQGAEMIRTKEVMDVWFDSGAMPYAQDHVLGEAMNFEPKQADYISEAIDQTRGWFYTLHAVSNLISPTPRNAYKNVICLGHILDAEGQKMSKSKGNVVDPWAMFDKYGADTIRLWMYSVNQPGDSKNFDEKTVKELEGKVFTLVYNVLSFYELYRDKEVESDKIESENILDKWILARFNMLVEKTTNGLDNYKTLEPVREIREFIGDLSTWYLRRSRDRLKDGDVSSKQTLYYVLKNLAKILAPFAPFSAEDLWLKLRTDNDEESVHLTSWPETQKIDTAVLEEMQKVRDVCTEGNMLRKKNNVPIRQILSKISIVRFSNIEKYQKIITDELNLESVLIMNQINPLENMEGRIYVHDLDININDDLKRKGNYRELVRALQDLRKESGLTPEDTINLIISENAKALVQEFETDLKKTVQIREITFADGSNEIKVDAEVYKVSIEK